METNKIIHGDCIEKMRELPNESVDLILTDPPFMISQKGKFLGRKSLSHKSWKRNMDIKLDFGEWDHFKDEEEFFGFTESWFKQCVRILKPKGLIYIFFDNQKTVYFDLFLSKKYGIKPRTVFVWLKSNPAPSFRKVNWLSASEFIWVGSKGDCRLKNFLQQKEMFNYIITPNKSSYGETEHPTEKPKELIKKLILVNTNENDIILDCFAGSGVVGEVALKLNRKFILIEKDEKWIKVIKDRIKPYQEQTKLIEIIK